MLAHNRIPALLHRFADATFWPHVAGGCHFSRDTQSMIERAGFTIESVDRFPFSPSPIIPPTPHLIGIARRAVRDVVG